MIEHMYNVSVEFCFLWVLGWVGDSIAPRLTSLIPRYVQPKQMESDGQPFVAVGVS